MAIGSGLAGQLGVVSETTWGTRTVPTRFYEFDNENVNLVQEFIQGQGIRPTQRVPRSDRRVTNKKGAAGSVSCAVLNKSFGLLLQHALGVAPVITTPSGATTTRLQTFNAPGDPTGKSMTMQIGTPDTGGTVRVREYTGVKITDFTLSQALNALLMLSVNVDGYDETTNQSLAAASYTAGMSPFSFDQLAVTLGGGAFSATNFSFAYNAGLNTQRGQMGDTRKKEQIPDQFAGITGTLEGEFVDLTQYAIYQSQASQTLIATWTGATIEGAFKYALTLTLNAVRFTGNTPNVAGPGIVMQPLPFIVLDDGVAANPVVLTYQSVDAAA